VANPNNPTGTYISASELKRLRDGLPEQVILAIDAAYAEFCSNNDYSCGMDLAQTTPNTVSLRTFSKLHGLGGARVGWGLFPAAIADVMNRLRSPFNVGAAAQAAATAAIEDLEFQALAKAHNDYWVTWLMAEIRALGLEVTDSVTNFVLVHFAAEGDKTAEAANAYLQSKGVIVRRVAGYSLPHALRISIGTGEENQIVIDTLKAFLAS
jgi:histidinol-phosphate aminotransferase